MQWRKPHPWDPGYVLPKNVMDEPARFGTIVTGYTPRGTFYPSNSKGADYALPGYLAKEGEGRGVFVTKQTPRKTIQTFIPEYLGDDLEGPPAGAANDPVTQFGKTSAAYVMRRIQKVPASERKDALRNLFQAIDPKLWSRVQEKATEMQDRGMMPQVALEKAMAAAMSQGLVEDFVRIGQTGKVKKKSLAGLGAYGESARAAIVRDATAMHGLFGDIGKGIKNAATAVGKTVYKAGAKVVDFHVDAAKFIGKAGCAVANSPAGQMGAGAGAAAFGAPPQVGVAGAQVASTVCSSVTSGGAAGAAAPVIVQQAPGTPSWLLPAAIGGGALILVLALRK